MTAIKGDYRTHKHIPSRSCYQLIIEVSEEEFPKVCDTLGYPKTGENTYVAIALLDKQLYNKSPVVGKSDIPQTAGEVLRNRAIMLCKDNKFLQYIADTHYHHKAIEQDAIDYIYLYCDIKSRSELTTDIMAQDAFIVLLKDFDAWKVSNRYADNLTR